MADDLVLLTPCLRDCSGLPLSWKTLLVLDAAAGTARLSTGLHRCQLVASAADDLVLLTQRLLDCSGLPLLWMVGLLMLWIHGLALLSKLRGGRVSHDIVR